MKYLATLGTVCIFAIGEVAGHYIWTNVDLDGSTGGVGEGIRPNSNYNSPVIGALVS
jgi:hypothetical protein